MNVSINRSIIKKGFIFLLISLISFNMASISVNSAQNREDNQTSSELVRGKIPLQKPEISAMKDWTFMVFLDADNNLEVDGIDDMNEMEMSGSDSNINVIVQIDRTPGYDSSNGDWPGTRRYYITKDYSTDTINSEFLGYPPGIESNMGDPATLQNFIEFAKSNYPANNYALILWDHGSGVLSGSNIGGVCFDDSSDDDYLTLSEIQSVLSLPSCSVDLLGFDACLMGAVEIHYQLKDVVDVIVASEDVEPSEGYPYDTILNWLRINPSATPQQLAEQIVIKYDDSYPWYKQITQAAVNALTSEFISSLNNFISDLNSIAVSQKAGIQNAREKSIYFLSLGLAYRDLYNFTREIQAHCTGAIDSSAQYLLNNISSIVVEEKHSKHFNGVGGLSIYFPETINDYKSNYGSTDFAVDLQWDEFLTNYYTGGSAQYDDGFEENDNLAQASIISPGFYPSLFCNSTDYDVYNISAEEGELIDVSIYFDHSTGDLDLELYNTTSEFVTGSYTETDNEEISHIAEETGFYTILIYQYSADIYELYVPYSLDVDTPIVDDPYEDNDEISSPAFILNNTFYSDLVCIDSDFYAFWAQEGCLINITLHFNYAEGDLDLYLYDDYFDPITGSYTAENGENILYGALYSGYYIVEVNNYENNTDYSMIANVTDVDDGCESNNDFDEAYELSYGTLNNMICINIDIYNLSLPSGIWLNISLFFNHDDGDLDLYLYNATYDLIAESLTFTNNEVIYYNVSVAGSYYILVHNYEINFNYSLSINPTIKVWDDKFEENDDISSAYSLAIGQAYTNLTCLDIDVYQIIGSMDYQIAITLDYNVSDGDIDLYLLNNTPAVIGVSAEMADQDVITFTPEYNGIFYIIVHNYEINLHYNITILQTEISPEDGEVNDDDDEDSHSEGNGISIAGIPIMYLVVITGSMIVYLLRKKTIKI